ncbi:MAG: 3-oxoadipate enol-lactonase [Chloroflexi bacterium]|nr:MAG: 3-oxoadipate enol-lactonase [Chloroflexota bacterium]
MATPTTDLRYRIEGGPDNPVLVLSHAMGASMAMWEPQVERLSRAFRVLRYDHRGHGGSPVPAGPYTIGDIGGDLLRLLDRLGLERISFCGLSLGGMVGLWLAANAPERIDRLVLCCSAPRMLRPEDFAARARQVRSQGMASIADAVIGRWFTPAFASRRPDLVAATRAVFESSPAEGYAATCEALAGMDQRADLPRIVAPTLVIAAEHDQSTPPEQSREMVTRMRDARLLLVAAAAHLANVEQPEAVTEGILDHLTARR